MKYALKTLQYFKPKRLLVLTLFSILPGIALLMFNSDFSTKVIRDEYHAFAQSSFRELLEFYFGASFIGYFFLGIVVCSISTAFFVGIIDRDMKTGSFKVQHFAKRLDHNILPSLLAVFSFFVLLIVFKLLASMLTYALASIIHGPASLYLIIIGYVILTLLVIMAFSALIMLLPLLQDGGISFRSAMADCAYNVKKFFWKTFFAIIIPIGVGMLAQQFLRYLGATTLGIFAIVFNVFFYEYVMVLMYVIYFDVHELERMDLSNAIKW